MSSYPRAAFVAGCLIVFVAPAAARADDPPAGVRLGSSRLRHYCTSLAWAPDGKTFASAGGPDGTIRVWDAADGKELRRFKPDNDLYSSVLFDAEGKRLLAGGASGAVHVLDATTGAELSTLRSGRQPIVGLAWRPDGMAATLVGAGIFRIWDPKTGKMERQSGAPPTQPVFDYETLSADGGRYAVCVKEEVEVLTAWDADGKELFHAPPGLPSVSQIALSADGKTLAVFGGAPGVVALWDVDAGKEVRRFDDVYLGDRTLVFSPNGKYFAGRGGDGAVHVWGVASGKDLRQLDLTPGTGFMADGKALAFSTDGKKLIGVQGSEIHVWDVETGAEVPGFVGHNESVESICFSADGHTVLTCGWDRAVCRWDAATGKQRTRRTWPDAGVFPGLAIDDRSVLLLQRGALYRWDPEEDQLGEHPLISREWPAHAPSLSRSADGKTLAAPDADGLVHIWDAENGKERAKVKLEKPYGYRFILSADGRYLATGNVDTGPRLWDAATGAKVRAFPTPPAAPDAHVRRTEPLAFSADGRTLLSGDGFELIWWETATGRQRGHGRLPRNASGPLAYSPDGALLVAGASTGPTVLLDAADGRLLTELPGDLGRVRCLAFTADGKRLAAGGEDGSALIWDVTEYSKRKPAAELSAERLAALWDDLQNDDAVRAYQAILALAASPKTAAPFLKERVTANWSDQRRTARLIMDLDDDDFDVRESAQKELEKLGGAALPAVRKALDADPSPESRRRLQQVLEKRKGFVPVPEEVWCVRAVEALERGGSPEAVEALRSLAKDPPGALVKQEAEAALERLARRKETP